MTLPVTLPMTPGLAEPMAADRAATGDRLGYRRELDGARGLAVALVLVGHAFGLHNGGALGVEMFFVLSGFLITTLLLEEFWRTGSVSFTRFYARRALRLLPALYLLLGVVSIVALTLPERRWYLTSVIACVLYVGNMVSWVSAYRYSGLAHSIEHLWSLAVEEQFYLVWPFVLLFLLQRFGERRASRWVAALAVLSLIVRTVYRIGRPGAWGLPWTYGDALLLGAWLAFERRSGRLGLFPSIAAVLLFPLIALAVSLPDMAGDRFFSFLFSAWAIIGAAAVLAALASTWLARILGARPLVYLGYISYGLYLVHVPIVVVLANDTRWSYWAQGLTAVVLSVAIAGASRRWFEAWFLKRKPAVL